MRIGIDFDNTIIDYSNSFFDVAKDLQLITDDVKRDKNSIKYFFINQDQENVWTKLQGIVYGDKISLSNPYPGLISCLEYFEKNNYDFFIVSHKTKYPYIGKKTNLHDSAFNWIKKNLNNLKINNVFFETTIENKINKIRDLNLNFFIDDLEKILLHPNFPSKTKKILFSPQEITIASHEIIQVSSWKNIPKVIR